MLAYSWTFILLIARHLEQTRYCARGSFQFVQIRERMSVLKLSVWLWLKGSFHKGLEVVGIWPHLVLLRCALCQGFVITIYAMLMRRDQSEVPVVYLLVSLTPAPENDVKLCFVALLPLLMPMHHACPLQRRYRCDMGGCPTYGPLLDPSYNTALNI